MSGVAAPPGRGEALSRRSVVFLAPRQAAVREEPLPEPDAGQVRVETLLSGISPGTELLVYRGQAPSELAVDETIEALAGSFRFPLKYGYAAVGRVTALGAGVAEGWRGRRVFAFQPHESAFLARPEALLALPEDLEPEEAVFLPTLETAATLVLDGQPLLGEQVAVFGQGIVGLLCTALLARFPLASLVTLDRYPRRRAASLALGAHASLDPLRPDAAAQLAALLQGGRRYPGADLAYEVSGDPAALDQAIAATGFHGRVVVASWYGQKRAELHLGGQFHRRRQRILSSQVSTIAPELSGRWSRERRLELALALARELRPARFITHRFPLARAAEAYALLDERPEDAIQVVLTY